MANNQTTLRVLLAAGAMLGLGACSGPLLTHDAAGSAPTASSLPAQAVHGQAQSGQFQ